MWHGASVRKLSLLIFGPMLVETVLMLLLSWMNITATRMGVPPRQQMLISVAGAAAYCVSSLIAGRWVKVRFAPLLMIVMLPGAVCVGLTAVWWGEFWAFVIGTTMMGTMIGHYYVPFQVNMSHVQPFRTLAWSIACYNVAWGTGGSIGPLVGGWCRTSPFGVIVGIVIGLAVLHTILQLIARTAPPSDHAVKQTHAFASTAAQRRMAWVGVFVAAVLIRGLWATLWPALAVERGWDKAQEAIGLMLMFVPVPLGALALARMRRLLVKPYVLMAGMACGGIGFGLLPFAPTWGLAVVCAACVGLGESVAVFHSLYYANADEQTRARSVGISEALAGASFLVGPMLFGLIAWKDGSALRVYITGAAMMAATLVWVIWQWRKEAPPVAEPAADQPR